MPLFMQTKAQNKKKANKCVFVFFLFCVLQNINKKIYIYAMLQFHLLQLTQKKNKKTKRKNTTHKNFLCIFLKVMLFFLFKHLKHASRKETDSMIGLMQERAIKNGLTRFWYFPLHSPLLRESWLVSFVSLRWLICLNLARILAWADVPSIYIFLK